jgi:hypothetical protein
MKKTLIFLCLFSIGQLARAQGIDLGPNNIVIQTNEEIMTSFEVRDYIDHVLISDQNHSQLFEMANQNFEKYNKLKDVIIKSSYDSSLKKIALIRHIQQIAIKKNERRFFYITASELKKETRKRIESIKNVLLNKSKTSDSDNDLVVKILKSTNFPFSEKESNETIYERWVNHLSYQIKEEIRQDEAMRFICSLSNCKKKNPTEIIKSRINVFKMSFLKIFPLDQSPIVGEEALNYILINNFQYLQKQKFSTRDLRYYFIGRIIDQKFEITAVNDWDITGQLGALGYPKTDDFGRTSGIMLSYLAKGEEGNIKIELEDWLFTEKISETVDVISQNVEEQETLRIASRKFLDVNGNQWFVLGFAANHRIQQESFHSFIQNAFHSLNSNTRGRDNRVGDGEDLFLEGLIGLGGQYSVLEKSHVDLKISGELLLIPSVGTINRSRVNVSGSVDFNVYGNSKDYPIFAASLFGNYSLLTDGGQESVVGLKVGVGAIIKRVYLRADLFVMRYDQDLDRRYEHAESWTTGVSISMTLAKKPIKDEYVFN